MTTCWFTVIISVAKSILLMCDTVAPLDVRHTLGGPAESRISVCAQIDRSPGLSGCRGGCQNRGMPICDYFSAADDQAAVAVLDTLGGPSQASLDVVELKNLDPVICMAQLEAIMAGCSYEEARQRPRSGKLLSSPEAESAFVVSVSDTLCELLAAATEDDLAQAAELWSQTEELRMMRADAETMAGVLADLAGLARRAQASSQRLYCWLAL
jgi:hypothetical protein